MHIFFLFPVLAYSIILYLNGKNYSSKTKLFMAIAAIIVFWGHFQDAGFLMPQNSFFVYNNDFFTAFSKLPLSSQHLLYIYTIISFSFYYMLLK
jgi:hypothetical protein